MKKLFILCIFALLALSTTLTFAQSQNWADYGLSEEAVKYLSEEEKQEILNSLTSEQTAQKQKAEMATTSPVSVSDTSEVQNNTDIVSCFDYYTFGSIEADMTSQSSSVVSGMNMEFFGNVKNNNAYPVVQGTLYVKIFKNVGGEKDSNGPDVVDQFVVLDNLTIPANGSVPVEFSWNVPAYAQTGDYQLVTFFTSDKKFNLLGLSFTDDIVGNSFDFSVSGEGAGVMFDKSSVVINNDPYYFAAYPPRIATADDTTIKLSINNTTNQTQSTQVKWKLYRWDAMNPDNLIREFTTDTNVDADSSMNVEFSIPEKEEPVYYLVGELMYQDSKSIVGIRFVRDGVDRVRLNFPSITTYPLVKGEQATLFTCLHNSGQSPQVPNNKVVLEIQDERGRVIETYSYEGIVTGDMMAVKKDFISNVSLDIFSVKASLYTDNKLVDESIMKYDCKLIDPTKCNETNWLQTILSLIGGLALLVIIWFLIKKYKNKHNIILPLFILLLSFGILSTPAVTEAKSKSWNTVENVTLLYFWNNLGSKNSEIQNGWGKGLKNPNVTVTYNVEVQNIETGALITGGDSVPVGTKLKFKFLKHKSSDLYWFGTGYSTDSPYGDWKTGGPSNQSCLAKDFVGKTIWNNKSIDVYVPLVVSPPVKTFSSGSGLSCGAITGNESNGYVAECTVTGVGSLNPEFNFAATTGKFYYRYYGANDYGDKECYANNIPMEKDSLDEYSSFSFGGYSFDGADDGVNADVISHTSNPYTLQVPSQTISYSLIATEVEGANIPPNAPTISGPTTGYTSTSYTFSFTATDTDGDTIKYGVDWNNDSTVDQWFPSSGYVNSGAMREGAKSWGNDGVKTFQARTQDEHGALSGWTSHTITLTFPPENGVCSTTEAFMCNPGTVSATSTNNDNVSRWDCLGINNGSDALNCVYNNGQAKQYSCIAPTVQFGSPSVYTASPSGSEYTYRWYSDADQTNALTSYTASRIYTTTYSQAGPHPLWVAVKKNNGSPHDATCTAIVGCGTQPANGACKANGKRTIYDLDSCQSDGTWVGYEESCVTGEPYRNEFIFRPSIAASATNMCPLFIDIESVSSCWLLDRADDRTDLVSPTNEKLKTTGQSFPVGTYTLYCKGVGAASSTTTEIGTQACFSNADSREN